MCKILCNFFYFIYQVSSCSQDSNPGKDSVMVQPFQTKITQSFVRKYSYFQQFGTLFFLCLLLTKALPSHPSSQHAGRGCTHLNMAEVGATLFYVLDVLFYRGVGLIGCRLQVWGSFTMHVVFFPQFRVPSRSLWPLYIPPLLTQELLGLWHTVHRLWEDWGTLLDTSLNASLPIPHCTVFWPVDRAAEHGALP